MAMPAPERATDIAIIGMAGRFPGADDVETFWGNLLEGRESIRQFSREELVAAGLDADLVDLPNFVPACGSIEGIERFDAGFFGISPHEAELMDPQQRFFLECAHEAVESSGYDPGRPPGRVGVYCGCGLPVHMAHVLNQRGPGALLDLEVTLGNDKDQLATRTSYKLHLTGPSVTVQTACSSSMTALHLACQALLTGECDMALAGGVALRIPAIQGYLYQAEGILSPDGHCRPFDAEAQGTVPGCGVGVVVLRRLDEALAAGDPVRAVIKATAINNDGADKVGFSAPSVTGQANVITEALQLAQIDPASIGYVETHGTGTSLGDLIEITALKRGYGSRSQGSGDCILGAVKSSIGHPDAASGIAGLIKTVMVLERGVIPPTLHFRKAHPDLQLAEAGFRLNGTPEPWPSVQRPRRAGASSFGMGGTNVHVILEEAPPPMPRSERGGPQLLILSAKTPTALRAYRERLADWLEHSVDCHLADVAFTLLAGRARFPVRWSAVCRDRGEAIRKLRESDEGRQHPESEDSALAVAAAHWLQGQVLDSVKLCQGPSRRLRLPTYPFERQSYWLDGRGGVGPSSWKLAHRPEAPGHERPVSAQAVIPPETPTEQVVCAIWQEVLGVHQVGIQDSFLELGGDSLRAIEVKARLESAFPIEVGLQSVMQAGTSHALAAHVDGLLLSKLKNLDGEEVQRLLETDAEHPHGGTHP